MKVSCLIPLIKFDYEWVRATGLRFSQLERLILKVIDDEGGTDVAVLSATFKLHDRVLIETIKNLIRIGLIAVGPGEKLTVTALGVYAINKGLPETPTTKKFKFVVFREQLTGKILAGNDVYSETKGHLSSIREWDKFIQIPAKITDERVDEGLINTLVSQELNRRNQRKMRDNSNLNRKLAWIYEIKPGVEPVHVGKHFIPVDVNTENGEIVGLPYSLKHLPYSAEQTFEEYIFGYAAQKVESGATIKEFSYWKNRIMKSPVPGDEQQNYATFETEFSAEDLLLDDRSHFEYLISELERANADTTFAVVSAFINKSVLEKMNDALAGALERGAKIDLLWGLRESETDSKALESLTHLAESLPPEYTRKFSFNTAPTRSHIKLLLSVRKKDNEYESSAVIGSFNWLSRRITADNADAKLGNVSIVLRHPHLVSQLCSVVAQLWKNSTRQENSIEQRKWRKLMPELSRCDLTEPNSNTEKCQARIVHGDQHLSTLKDMMENAESRLVVSSYRLDDVAKERVRWLKPIPPDDTKPEIYFLYEQKRMEAVDMSEIQNKVEKQQAKLIQKTPLHSKIIISDDDALISSFNFLSAIEKQNDVLEQSELGLFVKGGIVAKLLWQGLHHLVPFHEKLNAPDGH